MVRKKGVRIEQKIVDPVVEKLKKLDREEYVKERENMESSLSKTINTVFTQAQILSGERYFENQDDLKELGLYTLQEAYDIIRKNGIKLSFRAFGGRIERGSIESLKIGNRRYIAEPVLRDFVYVNKNYMTVREAYETLKKYDPRTNHRAFVGRIEKGIIPSVKIGTQRGIPKDVVEAYAYVFKNYYTLTDLARELNKELKKRGVKTIRRNALERRLDRNRIPYEKIGGKRYIPKTILKDLVAKEVQRHRNREERSGPKK